MNTREEKSRATRVDGDQPPRAARPAGLTALREDQIVALDVREDIRGGGEPFARIMAAAAALGEEQVLVLRTPFEPVPLYHVLGRRGLRHWSEATSPTDWLVWFYRDAGAAPGEGSSAERREPMAPRSSAPLDVRGLEPPLPMVRVLERVERLAAGEQLEVLHDRRPLFLYPQLDERGLVHETDEPEPGVIRIRIRRAR